MGYILINVVCLFLQVMKREVEVMRQSGPTLFTQARHFVGVLEVAKHILDTYTQVVKEQK